MTDHIGVGGLLAGWEGRADNLIPVLQEIQSEFRYLPEEALREVSRRFRIPLIRVFHVATFYNSFSLEPRGRNQVRVCQGTACHVRGSQRVLDKVLRELNLTTSGTTPDFEFSVEPVRCLGCCALAPVMQVGHRTYGHLIQSRVPKILRSYRHPALAAV